ncbi:MAG: glycosyltransferase [Polyangiaceae bacterium]|nr:glycosyltransferase [Polyangiaceae bacterium]MCL4751377.1 glycosyltransferase [Myxococcales bacterium]
MARVLLSYRDHAAPSGGGAVHGFQVVEQLKRLGHTVITAEKTHDARLERHPRTLRAMRGMLEQADVVYMRCHVRAWDELLLLVNRATHRRPVVVEVNAIAEEQYSHSESAWTHVRVAVERFQFHRMVGLSDAALCVSQQLADFVRATHPIAPERVHVVPNGGIPAPELPPPRGARPFRAVWAGYARWPWQALDTILAASKLLRERVPDAEVRLYTDGRAEDYAAWPAVRHFAPLPHAQMRQALQEADAALCLYRPMRRSPAGFYNSSLKLFDYMAAGLPVVASALGQICEVVDDGVNGYLVGDDPRAVAEALAKLAESPERARQMGAAARDTVIAGYTWDHVGERIQAVFDSLGVR